MTGRAYAVRQGGLKTKEWWATADNLSVRRGILEAQPSIRQAKYAGSRWDFKLEDQQLTRRTWMLNRRFPDHSGVRPLVQTRQTYSKNQHNPHKAAHDYCRNSRNYFSRRYVQAIASTFRGNGRRDNRRAAATWRNRFVRSFSTDHYSFFDHRVHYCRQ